jgi:hypothetical protein
MIFSMSLELLLLKTIVRKKNPPKNIHKKELRRRERVKHVELLLEPTSQQKHQRLQKYRGGLTMAQALTAHSVQCAPSYR